MAKLGLKKLGQLDWQRRIDRLVDLGNKSLITHNIDGDKIQGVPVAEVVRAAKRKGLYVRRLDDRMIFAIDRQAVQKREFEQTINRLLEFGGKPFITYLPMDGKIQGIEVVALVRAAKRKGLYVRRLDDERMAFAIDRKAVIGDN